jgi:hypothetical protein
MPKQEDEASSGYGDGDVRSMIARGTWQQATALHVVQHCK